MPSSEESLLALRLVTMALVEVVANGGIPTPEGEDAEAEYPRTLNELVKVYARDKVSDEAIAQVVAAVSPLFPELKVAAV